MIRFQVFTLFPELFTPFLSETIIGRAIEEEKLEVGLNNYRDFGIGKHRKVDAPPFGGGAGMVLRPEPITESLQATEAKIEEKMRRILICPQGAPFDQKKAVELSLEKRPIALICGRFEGFDERIRSNVDEEISLGDFVLLGGEIPAMAIIEATSRLCPGVVGNQDSVEEESFSAPLLEYAQYTKPLSFDGEEVPEILRSGNHGAIAKWRAESALERTKKRRPDLYRLYKNSKKD